MSDSVIRGRRTRAAVQKKATSARWAKGSKATSVAVLVLSGSTALRRRKSAETLAESLDAVFQGGFVGGGESIHR
jgi:hypothetical protein